MSEAKLREQLCDVIYNALDAHRPQSFAESIAFLNRTDTRISVHLQNGEELHIVVGKYLR